jgi:hypothetical protein
VEAALFEPSSLWAWVRRRLDQRFALAWLLAIAAAGGLVVAVATEIGVREFNTDWNYVAGYSVQAGRGAGPFMLLWAIAAGLSVAQGLCGGLLLPMYGKARDWMGGLAVGIVGSIPIYATGLALILMPGILLVCIAFLVSCAWWGSGARFLLGVPDGEAADHVVASIVTGGVAVSILAAGLAAA